MPPTPPPNYSGLQPGERRLYLVNTNAGILAYHGVMESKDAIVDKDWRQALAELRRVTPAPIFTGAEIHCHGLPAEIRLNPIVTADTVEEFGRALQGLLQPGALIEVLACKVASFPMDRIIDHVFRSMPDMYASDDEQRGFQDMRRKSGYQSRYEEEERRLERMNRIWFGPNWNTAMSLFRPFIVSRAMYLRQEGFTTIRYVAGRPQVRTTVRVKPMAPVAPDIAWSALFEAGDRLEGILFDKGKNGPRFCQRLAKASGCVVRAAWISQAQDRDVVDGKPIGDWQAYLIGDWEGFVFDFDGNGLKEAHWCLKRPVANAATWDRMALRSTKVKDSDWMGVA